MRQLKIVSALIIEHFNYQGVDVLHFQNYEWARELVVWLHVNNRNLFIKILESCREPCERSPERTILDRVEYKVGQRGQAQYYQRGGEFKYSDEHFALWATDDEIEAALAHGYLTTNQTSAFKKHIRNVVQTVRRQYES